MLAAPQKMKCRVSNMFSSSTSGYSKQEKEGIQTDLFIPICIEVLFTMATKKPNDKIWCAHCGILLSLEKRRF